MGVKLNVRKFRKIASNSSELGSRIEKVFRDQIDLRQDKLVAEFDSHPVTQEIELGNGAPNISGILNGYGNLFTFIGFSKSSDPTKIVRNYLSKKLNYKKTRTNVTSKGFTVYFSLETPGIKDIASFTQVKHLGRSWVTGIENGKIDGFQYYLNRWRRMRGSRSGKGVQVDNKLRNQNVKPTAYVDKMLKRFRKSLQEIK